MRHGVRWLVFVGHLDFVILSSFVIRHWAFVIDFYQSLAFEHATAVRFAASMEEDDIRTWLSYKAAYEHLHDPDRRNQNRAGKRAAGSF